VTTLVTGATGFLGGHAVHGLLERGERVLALVRAKDDQEARARLWTALELHLSHEGVEGPRRLAGWLSTAALLPVRGDIREPGLGLSGRDAARVLADVDRVVHAAASLNRRSNTACVDVNLRGGLEVVRLSRRLADAGRLRRHLHVSTVAVAGKRRGEVVQEDQAVEWDRPDWDPYARTKKFGEHLVRTLLHDAPTKSTGTMSSRASGRNGSTGDCASRTNARTMSNCVVSGQRESPMTMLGRTTTAGASWSSVRTRCSPNFFVRA
jgi:thioester reductase-like protein